MKQGDLSYFCNLQIFQKAAGILASSGHVLAREFFSVAIQGSVMLYLLVELTTIPSRSSPLQSDY